ncbi:hypothetical protein M427DRAFT_147259, partial [Gonapodya prolifera JEL478]
MSGSREDGIPGRGFPPVHGDGSVNSRFQNRQQDAGHGELGAFGESLHMKEDQNILGIVVRKNVDLVRARVRYLPRDDSVRNTETSRRSPNHVTRNRHLHRLCTLRPSNTRTSPVHISTAKSSPVRALANETCRTGAADADGVMEKVDMGGGTTCGWWGYEVTSRTKTGESKNIAKGTTNLDSRHAKCPTRRDPIPLRARRVRGGPVRGARRSWRRSIVGLYGGHGERRCVVCVWRNTKMETWECASETTKTVRSGAKKERNASLPLSSPGTRWPAAALTAAAMEWRDTDSRVLHLWVHEATFSKHDLIINPDLLPGISENDVLEIIPGHSLAPQDAGALHSHSRLFLIPRRPDRDMLVRQPNLQVSIERTIASAFDLRARGDVVLKKVDRVQVAVDYVEIMFKDQYFARPDMWLLRQDLENTCLFRGRKLGHFGIVRAAVRELYAKGEIVASGLVTPTTKVIFRSESAKVYIFIQMSKEMAHFDEDGELYRGKCLNGFLLDLYERWRHMGTNHLVTIVLTTRVFYPPDMDHTLLGTNGIQRDGRTGRFYRDFYRVVIDFEARAEWPEVLRKLKEAFARFEADVLQVTREDGSTVLYGENSMGYEGNVLEALNIALNPFDRHFVDRDLLRTGLSIMFVTPTPGFFECSRDLLRLSTQRMIDHGLGLDIVSLCRPPLYTVPLFRFFSEPTDGGAAAAGAGAGGGYIAPTHNALEGMANPTNGSFDPQKFLDVAEMDHVCTADPIFCKVCESEAQDWRGRWTIPHWIDMSFWNRQAEDRLKGAQHGGPEDVLRGDRFMFRCRMHSVQIGLQQGLEHNVIVPVEIPALHQRFEKLVEYRGGAPSIALSIENDSIDAASMSTQHNASSLRPRINRLADAVSIRTSHAIDAADEYDEYDELQFAPMAIRSKHSTEARGYPAGGPELVSPESEKASSPSRGAIATDSEHMSPDRAEGKGRPSVGAVLVTESDRMVSARQAAKRAENIAPVTSTLVASAELGNQFTKAVEASKTASPTSASATSSPVTTTGRTLAAPVSAYSYLMSLFRGTNSGHEVKSERNSHSIGDTTMIPTREAEVDKAHRRASAEVSRTANQNIPARGADRTSVQQLGSGTYSGGRHTLSRSFNSSDPVGILHSPRDREAKFGGSSPREVDSTASKFSPNSSDLVRFKGKVGKDTLQHSFKPIHPFNPAKNIVKITPDIRRWNHIFPQHDQYADDPIMKWKSLCTPACLPLTSDFVPTTEEIAAHYKESSYIVSPSLDDVHTDKRQTDLDFVFELILHRLGQGFQLHPQGNISPSDTGFYHGPRVIGASFKSLKDLESEGIVTFKSGVVHESNSQWSKIPKEQGYLLSHGDHIHRLIPDSTGSQNVEVKRYVKKGDSSNTTITYSAAISPKNHVGFYSRTITFRYAPLAQYAWNYLDQIISGYRDDYKDDLRFWRTRFVLLPLDTLPSGAFIQHAGLSPAERLNEEEIRIAAFTKFLEQFEKIIMRSTTEPQLPKKDKFKQKPLPNSVKVTFTTYNPSGFVATELQKLKADYEGSLEKTVPKQNDSDVELLLTSAQWSTIFAAMHSPGAVTFKDRRWHFRFYEQVFIGAEWVDWAVRAFADISTREDAVNFGQKLMENGVIQHCLGNHGFLDGHYWYRLQNELEANVAIGRNVKLGGDHESPKADVSSGAFHEPRLSAPSSLKSTSRANARVELSKRTKIDVDFQKRSKRPEWVYLHYDTRLIDDLLGSWSRTAERCGLRMVEVPISQTEPFSEENPFSSVTHVPLVHQPPTPIELRARLPAKMRVPKEWFEHELLKGEGFILDMEADARFPEGSVKFSYSRTKFKHTQYIHKTGVAFVQILEPGQGFNWVANRLLTPNFASGPTARTPIKGSDLRSSEQHLSSFKTLCKDAQRLTNIWETSMQKL